MNFLKDEPKSWTTRQSDVNPNTIVENSFLEDFFRHILADLHEGKISNFVEKKHQQSSPQAHSHSVADKLFEIDEEINLQTVMKNLSEYFMKKSPSFAEGELSQLLQMKYSNSSTQYPTYKKKQLLVVDVKIKADSERIGKMPIRMKEILVDLQEQKCPISEKLRNYKEEHINLIVVYFGYFDFSFTKNTHFEDQQICIFGMKLILRINAIFVSKVALMQTFKTKCKVPHLEEIDELLIQLYQLKRLKDKSKRKRQQKRELECQKQSESKLIEIVKNQTIDNIGIKAMIGITVVGFAVALGKFFS